MSDHIIPPGALFTIFHLLVVERCEVLWWTVLIPRPPLHCFQSLNLGIFIASFPKRNRSKRPPNWPNSVTAIETRALFVDRISPIISSPESIILDPLSVCPFLQNFSFSASCKRTSLVLAAFDLEVEGAFEEIT